MFSKNLAGSLHKEKRDILIMSYLSSLEFECLLFEATSYWLPWCRFSGLLLEQKRYETWKNQTNQKTNKIKPETNGYGPDREDIMSEMLSLLNCGQGEIGTIESWVSQKNLPSGENGNIRETRENVFKNKLSRSTDPTAIIRQMHPVLQSKVFQVHIHIIGKDTQGSKTKLCFKCRHQSRRFFRQSVMWKGNSDDDLLICFSFLLFWYIFLFDIELIDPRGP